jgi:hypothetical protein
MAHKVRKSTAITPVEYSGLQAAYDHFNKELFDGKLPDVFITYQRKARSLGYFAADRFNGRLDKAGRHELALNPDGFIGESDKEICSTLVHEQHHVWQHAKGTAPKRGYHDREWAAQMKLNGLQPTSTGMADGRETGQHMTQVISVPTECEEVPISWALLEGDALQIEPWRAYGEQGSAWALHRLHQLRRRTRRKEKAGRKGSKRRPRIRNS